MSSKKINYTVDSRTIIDRIVSATGMSQKQIASQLFNISDKNLSNKIRRNTIDLFEVINWATNENVDPHWILTGETPEPAPDKRNSVHQAAPIYRSGVDIELMVDVIKGVEGYLSAGNKTLDPETKGRLIAILYERYMGTGQPVSNQTVVSYLKLVA